MRTHFNLILCIMLLNLTACKDWLDLQPEGEVAEEQLFSSGEGYRSVLNGLYQAMGSASLYGREMTWGMIDCMGQYYTFGDDKTYSDLYKEAAVFNYTTNNVEKVIESIWRKAFNVVANANNLIQNIEKASPDLFKGREMERKLIMGEAYACRALIHFDLLRLFAPAPVNDDGGNYVPYVETYPNIQANGIGVKPYMEKVIADLERARELVMEFDTSALGRSVSASGKARFQNKLEWDMVGYNDINADAFFQGRGYRLSYYSIMALLARAYQYVDRHDDAFELAEKLIDYEVKGDYYTYQLYKDDFTDYRSNSANNRRDLKVISNLMFAAYNERAYEELELDNYYKKQTSSSGSNWLILNLNALNLFTSLQGTDESTLDYRRKYMIFLADGTYPLSGKWYLSDNEEVRDENVTIIPIIRGTEMHYIVAEYYARQNNFGEAQKILNALRMARGCVEGLQVDSWDSFVNALVNDARREWIAEGQLFYLYKRLNANVDFGRQGVKNRPLERGEYLLPIPSNQSL